MKVSEGREFQRFLEVFSSEVSQKGQKSCSQDISAILEWHEKQHNRKGTLWGSVKYVHNTTLQGCSGALAETQLPRSPCCQQAEQAAISNQDFSIGTPSMASAALPSYLWGSSQWIDTGKHHCPTCSSPSSPTPAWKKKHPSDQHWDNGIAHGKWPFAGDCQQYLFPGWITEKWSWFLLQRLKEEHHNQENFLFIRGLPLCYLKGFFQSNPEISLPSSVINLYWLRSKVWIK